MPVKTGKYYLLNIFQAPQYDASVENWSSILFYFEEY